MHSEPTTPAWTFITVTFNNAAILDQHWTFHRPELAEWIVVDNGSTDKSAEGARRLGAAHVIELPRNLGFGAANNIAMALVRTPYVAFVNPDITVDYQSLSKLEAAIEDSDSGIVAPQLVNSDGTLQPNGRGFPTLRHKIGNRSGRHHEEYFILAGPDERHYVCWVIGAAVAARTKTFEILGPWDDRYFIYYEDSDICIRAWNLGLTVQVDGAARWTHAWARETTKLRLRPWLHELSSALRFYTRYPKLIWSEEMATKTYPMIANRIHANAADQGRGANP